ncbi:MAG: tyrosine-type recombinase/integrase [Acidimicrobiia bacterium]|nr:tyrosine-type recombinase/integrase [Acidimicrobiia bacterium]
MPARPPEFAAVGIDPGDEWVFTGGGGEPIHPHAVYEGFRRIVANAGVPAMRFHDLRHTHGSPLIAEGVPVKVVSGAARPRPHRPHTSRPTSTSCPACRPTRPALPSARRPCLAAKTTKPGRSSVDRRGNGRRRRPDPEETPGNEEGPGR